MIPTSRTRAVGDIYYEAHMLHCAYTRYWQPRFRAADDWVHNSILEATLIHVRSLTEFFEVSRKTPPGKRPPFDDDVLAEDYNFPATTFKFPSSIRTQINKRVAHLSYERTRIDPNERHWDLSSFIPQILIRARKFFVHLRDTKHPFPEWPTNSMLENFFNETAAIAE